MKKLIDVLLKRLNLKRVQEFGYKIVRHEPLQNRWGRLDFKIRNNTIIISQSRLGKKIETPMDITQFMYMVNRVKDESKKGINDLLEAKRKESDYFLDLITKLNE